MRRTVAILMAGLMTIIMSACSDSENTAESEATTIPSEQVWESGEPHAVPMEWAEEAWEEEGVFGKTVQDFQKNEGLSYSGTTDDSGKVLHATYQFTTDDIETNTNLLLASIGLLGYYDGIAEYDEINTIHIIWLDHEGNEIGNQSYIRNNENYFVSIDAFHWKNAEYQSICEEHEFEWFKSGVIR